MAGSPAAILARLRRSRDLAARSRAETQLADRTTADAIDRAMRSERWVHAARLAFAHPVSGETVEIEVEPPSDFQALLAALREDAA